jgi:hypothetical protein
VDLVRRANQQGLNRPAPHDLRIAAQRLRVVGWADMTMARVQDEIDIARASSRLDYL